MYMPRFPKHLDQKARAPSSTWLWRPTGETLYFSPTPPPSASTPEMSPLSSKLTSHGTGQVTPSQSERRQCSWITGRTKAGWISQWRWVSLHRTKPSGAEYQVFMAAAALLAGGNFDYHSCHPQDPSGKVAARWQSKGNLGIVLQEFRTLQSALPGQWEVRATINVGVENALKIAFCLALFPHPLNLPPFLF